MNVRRCVVLMDKVNYMLWLLHHIYQVQPKLNTYRPVIWYLHFTSVKQNRFWMLTLDLFLTWSFQHIPHQLPERITLKEHLMEFKIQKNILLSDHTPEVSNYLVISLLKIKSSRSVGCSCSKSKTHGCWARFHHLSAATPFRKSYLKVGEINIGMFVANLASQLLRCCVKQFHSFSELPFTNNTSTLKFIRITAKRS